MFGFNNIGYDFDDVLEVDLSTIFHNPRTFENRVWHNNRNTKS